MLSRRCSAPPAHRAATARGSFGLTALVAKVTTVASARIPRQARTLEEKEHPTDGGCTAYWVDIFNDHANMHKMT